MDGRNDMRRKLNSPFLVALVAILLGGALLVSCKSHPKNPRLMKLDPEADQVLSLMCEKISDAPSLRIRARRRIDPALTPGVDLPETADISLLLLRPVHIYAVVAGDASERRMYYDGSRFVFHDLGPKTWEKGPVRGIDALIDMINERLGIRSPIAEFLRTYPYAGLTKKVRVGKYVGIEMRDGKSCHHLEFTEDRASFDLWVQVGKNLPVRLEARSTALAGRPGLEVEFLEFDLAPTLDREVFVFTPSADLTLVE